MTSGETTELTMAPFFSDESVANKASDQGAATSATMRCERAASMTSSSATRRGRGIMLEVLGRTAAVSTSAKADCKMHMRGRRYKSPETQAPTKHRCKWSVVFGRRAASSVMAARAMRFSRGGPTRARPRSRVAGEESSSAPQTVPTAASTTSFSAMLSIHVPSPMQGGSC